MVKHHHILQDCLETKIECILSNNFLATLLTMCYKLKKKYFTSGRLLYFRIDKDGVLTYMSECALICLMHMS